MPLEGAADIQWLRTARPLTSELSQIAVHEYSGDLLDAISMEKSGFRGMRLLIDPSLVNIGLRKAFRRKVGSNWLHVFKHLENSAYGPRLEKHQDVLWMATGNEEEWRQRRARMSTRMRFSARVPDEVLQAAATQVVFDECDAIYRSSADGK